MNPNQIDTSVDKISSALNDIFNGLDGSYIKSGNSNRIVLTDREHLVTAQNWVSALAAAIPGRFFIVDYNSTDLDIKVSLTAHCSLLSKGQSVCSEVITLSCGALKLPTVPSIIRAHLLTGRHSEIVMFPGLSGAVNFADLTHLAEFLVLDSALFWSERGFLKQCVTNFDRVIDLQWLLLAPWREVLRNAWELNDVASTFTNLRRISIVATNAKQHLPVHLLVGWLCHCLAIQPTAYTANSFECHKHNCSSIEVATSYSADHISSRSIAAITFEANSAKSPAKLDLQLQPDFRLQVIFNGQVVLIEKIEPADELDLLTKYFAVGESTVNYSDSLVRALELAQLEQGFL